MADIPRTAIALNFGSYKVYGCEMLAFIYIREISFTNIIIHD
jgi:hypothetical protein